MVPRASVLPAGADPQTSTIAGFSLIELLVVMTGLVIVSAMTVSFAHGRVDRSRAAGAAWYMAGRLGSARLEAVKRSAFVAVRFTEHAGTYRYATYVDGNRNGILARDVTRGIDRRISPEEGLDDHFPGVAFGIWPSVTAIDSGDTLNPADPIQIGRSTFLSFNPNGSATAGTLYLRGRVGVQFAVRVFGITGRTRVLRFDFQDFRWRIP